MNERMPADKARRLTEAAQAARPGKLFCAVQIGRGSRPDALLCETLSTARGEVWLLVAYASVAGIVERCWNLMRERGLPASQWHDWFSIAPMTREQVVEINRRIRVEGFRDVDCVD